MLGFTGLRIALYGGLAAAILLGVTIWHQSAITTARQEEAAATRSEVVNEKAAEYAADKAMYEQEIMDSQARIQELERRLAQASKIKAAAVERIEVIREVQGAQREEVLSMDQNMRRAAIRERLASPDPVIPTAPILRR